MPSLQCEATSSWRTGPRPAHRCIAHMVQHTERNGPFPSSSIDPRLEEILFSPASSHFSNESLKVQQTLISVAIPACLQQELNQMGLCYLPRCQPTEKVPACCLNVIAFTVRLPADHLLESKIDTSLGQYCFCYSPASHVQSPPFLLSYCRIFMRVSYEFLPFMLFEFVLRKMCLYITNTINQFWSHMSFCQS